MTEGCKIIQHVVIIPPITPIAPSITAEASERVLILIYMDLYQFKKLYQVIHDVYEQPEHPSNDTEYSISYAGIYLRSINCYREEQQPPKHSK